MKIRGVVRHLDPVGRVVIPIEFRNVLEIKPGDPLEIILQGNEVVIRRHTESCIFCGSSRSLKEFKGKKLCSRCQKSISEEIESA
ncbi:MAG: AbrB/MazE/SpoVT family DNA-binding domain-containing protein [Actinobacteria bacterium]|nr:AbrB/MazE/SpoVT family DNA-binding domain-containing protein [Actinomycetota bacterium]